MNRLFFYFIFISCFWSWAQSEIIHSIKIEGLKKSQKSYIKKLILAKENRVLDSNTIKKDLIRLIREPAVSHAYYSVNTQNDQNQLIFHIEENKTLIPALDLWTTIDSELAYHVGLNEYNFLGKGYLVGAFYRKNVFDGYGLILGNPNFGGTRFGNYFIFQKRNTFEPINIGSESYFYNYKFTSVDLNFDYKPDILKIYSLGVGLLSEEYNSESLVTNAILPNFFSTTKFLLKTKYDFNKVEQFYYFLFGVRNQLSSNWVWGKNFGAEHFFYALENETSFFKRIMKKGNWATRMRVGFSKNFSTPFPAFVVDNNLNTRGVGNKFRRGSAVGVLNSEYRHKLFERRWFVIQGNGFIDLATLLPAGGKPNELFEAKNQYAFGGIGLRFIHKFIHSAIFRIDYGVSLNQIQSRGIVFGIGQFF
jgi:outer membrane protein assembly factor BamA